MGFEPFFSTFVAKIFKLVSKLTSIIIPLDRALCWLQFALIECVPIPNGCEVMWSKVHGSHFSIFCVFLSEKNSTPSHYTIVTG
jgi:hypothetical protein